MGKRIFDIMVSFIGLSLLSPIIFILFVSATVDTKMNGIFKQIRIGQFGKPFVVYKLRTMNSLRQITSFGQWLRRSKLDELPQLLNVLIGEMSIVGPRPDIPGYYDTLSGEDIKILELKPGITSKASIKYSNEEELLAKQSDPLQYNDEIIFPDKVKMNLEYYYKHTFIGDLKIIFNTFFK